MPGGMLNCVILRVAYGVYGTGAYQVPGTRYVPGIYSMTYRYTGTWVYLTI